MAVGIATAAILLFVGTGGSVLPQLAMKLRGIGAGPEPLLVNALLLNIALIVFGWRRYRELKAEIEERREAEENARKLAAIDPLTGCLNRRSIEISAATFLVDTQKAGMSAACLMIDIDNFKQVNDLHGHMVGDKALRLVARPHRTYCCRQMPCWPGWAVTNSPAWCAIRMTTPNGSNGLQRGSLQSVADETMIGGIAVTITLSIGVANTQNIADYAPYRTDPAHRR